MSPPLRQILTPGARGMCTSMVSEGSRRRGVWRTCVPCASAPSCELISNLLRPARDPAESAPCYLAQRLSFAGGSGRVRRRSTAARGEMSPQPQPAVPPTRRSAQHRLLVPATGVSVATCPPARHHHAWVTEVRKKSSEFVRCLDLDWGIPFTLEMQTNTWGVCDPPPP